MYLGFNRKLQCFYDYIQIKWGREGGGGGEREVERERERERDRDRDRETETERQRDRDRELCYLYTDLCVFSFGVKKTGRKIYI